MTVGEQPTVAPELAPVMATQKPAKVEAAAARKALRVGLSERTVRIDLRSYVKTESYKVARATQTVLLPGLPSLVCPAAFSSVVSEFEDAG